MSNDDWPENRKFVLEKLNELSEKQDKILESLASVQAGFEGLKVRVSVVSGFFGLVGGALVALLGWLKH